MLYFWKKENSLLDFMKKILVLLLIVSVQLFSGCEKDDICDPNTPTTPRLIIDFYNIEDPTKTKNVTDLAIVGDGMSEGILFPSENKIQVPLQLTEDSTKFTFVLNSKNSNPALIFTDVLEFNYSRKTVYVSRACGYKTVFDLNNDSALPNPYVLNNDPEARAGNWIKFLTVEKYNIENENETHLKIYF